MKTKSKKLKPASRKIIALTHVSLDGVMQAPGGPDEDPSDGFDLGGWSMHFGDKLSGQVILSTVADKYDLLLGRHTYEIFAAFWPHQGDHPIAIAFNNAKKYVATRTLDKLDWENSQRIGDDLINDIRRLKASDGPPLHIWGSSNMLQTLTAAGLIDEYRLFIAPVVLGKGKRLFETGAPPQSLTLVETKCNSNGLLLNTYRPSGPVKTTPRSEKPSQAELARRKKLTAESPRI